MQAKYEHLDLSMNKTPKIHDFKSYEINICQFIVSNIALTLSCESHLSKNDMLHCTASKY